MRNNILKNLENLSSQISLSKSDKNEMADLIMARVENDLEKRKESSVSVWLRAADVFIPKNFALQPVATFCLVAALFLVSSFASIDASQNSLPGDTLYPVKIAAENVKYSLTFSDDQKAKYTMSVIESRVKELKTIINREENGKKEIQVLHAVQSITNALGGVQEKVQAMSSKEKNHTKALKTVKELDVKLAQMKESVSQTVERVDEDFKDELQEIFKKIEDTSIVTAAVLYAVSYTHLTLPTKRIV